jgi:hypothetical protein
MRWILCAALVLGCGESEKAKPVPAPTPPAAATDPEAVLGEWKIRTLQSSIKGKVSEPEEPIVPGSWILARDGSFTKTGGNELKGTYVFTGDHLIVRAIGPALDYEIEKLTKTEMVLMTRIEGANIENTTTFDRVDRKQ